MRVIIAACLLALFGLIACQPEEGAITRPESDMVPNLDKGGGIYLEHMDLSAEGKIGILYKGTWNPATNVNQVYMVDGVVTANIPFTFSGTDKDVAYYSYDYSFGVDLKQEATMSSELQVNMRVAAVQCCSNYACAESMYESFDTTLSTDYQLVMIDGESEGTASFSQAVFDPKTSDVYVDLYEDGQLVKSEAAKVIDSKTLYMSVLDFDPFLSTGQFERTKDIIDNGSLVYKAAGIRAVGELSD